MQTDVHINTLVIVGPGLIGGSVAAALKKHQRVERVIGVGRNPASLEHARSLGLIDEVLPLAEATAQADMILLAMPVGATATVLAELSPHLRPHTVVTDAGSTKADVVAAVYQTLPKAQWPQFVPAHPIAGSEATGPEAASAELYVDRKVILTPTEHTASWAVEQVSALWESCGARILRMDADTHDRVLASVSHVPHFLSAVYMWQVASAQDAECRLDVAGSGFRDFTRIAAGSAEVWRDIFLSNRDAVLAELKAVREAFEQAETALADADADQLERFLERAALARRLWGSRSGLR